MAFPTFAVITAVPAFTPLTTPLLLTVATFVLPDLNVTAASLSFVVALRVVVFTVYKYSSLFSTLNIKFRIYF